MTKWDRFSHLPVQPLGKDRSMITGCREHIALSRKAASEGMVLLKNDGKVLPLAIGSRVALFGKASADYVKGGGGSGDVTVSYIKNLLDGMAEKEAEGKVSLFQPLDDFYKEDVRKQRAQGVAPGQTVEPEIPVDILKKAAAYADVAVISICRFSGEGYDRTDDDFYLTEQEKKMVQSVKENFSRIVVVLNVGGMVDTSWFKDDDGIQAVLLAWQGGMEGGMAEADVLCGDRYPAGKLVDTFASCFADYPSSARFNESEEYVVYEEDIYVGYRYFETIPGVAEKVNYCFGYGLSYTDFELSCESVNEEEDKICFDVKVTNKGKLPGKEVVQVYVCAPQGKLGKPAKELKAFAKTHELKAGESQVLRLSVNKNDMVSYDDVGKVVKSAWLLEAGDYRFYVGNSIKDAKDTGFVWKVSETVVVKQVTARCVPYEVEKRMTADGSMEELPTYKTKEITDLIRWNPQAYTPAHRGIPSGLMPWYDESKKPRPILLDVAEGEMTVDEFIDTLKEEELISLLGGQPNTGVANTFGIGNIHEAGIPNVMTADGPAGLRIEPQLGICATAWPCATLLACTFDEGLVEQIGRAAALEIKENNIGVWLAPAMNIHRSPLCGRNFEYYSEDPLVAGKTAAAMVRGIQSAHIAASVKHFACNNKETNRSNNDSRLSERALREIYLKGFEIVVKEADPWTVMTSYNIMNGIRTSENPELLRGILREEWGYNGVVISDWWNHANHVREVVAGNDVRMPCGKPEELLEAWKEGKITEGQIKTSVKHILELLLKLD